MRDNWDLTCNRHDKWWEMRIQLYKMGIEAAKIWDLKKKKKIWDFEVLTQKYLRIQKMFISQSTFGD